jgi:hypothetical protein
VTPIVAAPMRALTISSVARNLSGFVVMRSG